MAKLFPKTARNPLGNMRVRILGDETLLYAETDPSFSYPAPEATYPQYRSTKHALCVRRTADGVIVPISEFADNTARVAAGPTFGLIDLCVWNKKTRATFIAKSSGVAFELMTPATLAAGDVYIHPAVDPDTGQLHPFKVDVNATKADSIAKISQLPPREEISSVVMAHFISDTVRDNYA